MSLISYDPRSLLETHNAKGKEVASLLDSIDLKDGPITRRTVIGQVTSYLQETGCPFIDVQAGWYMQNFLSVLKPSPEGQIVLPLDPHVKLPVIDIRDYGLWVLAGIEGKIEKGKSVQVFGEEITLAELVREIEDVTGKPTTYQKVAAKDLPLMKGVPEFLIGVFHDNYSSWEEFGYFGTWVLEIPTYLKRKPKTWKEFAVENKDLFY
ncbi:NAD(P)-binding protein [Atractiella rhizophila]|nr:NAD(P)-binding protein [Atractiella rhizophila]